MIDYMEALSRISINPEESKPLTNDWVLRSATSSMRSTMFSGASRRMQSLSSNRDKLMSQSKIENDYMNIDQELGKHNKLNLSGDLLSDRQGKVLDLIFRHSKSSISKRHVERI